MARPFASPASHPSPASGPGIHRSTAALVWASLRPEQWTKNLFVFAALLFGGELLKLDSVLRAIGTFAIFCALSGTVYLINDVADRDADRQHPLKRDRPIAAGFRGFGRREHSTK